MKIYINEKHEIKAINSTTNTSLIETEVNREETFGDMTDFMILNYCYKEDEHGYSIYPSSNYSKLVEEDYRIKTDETRAKIFKLEDEQVQQNNEILVNMLANTEMFEMILVENMLSTCDAVDFKILDLLLMGKSYEVVADNCFISHNTVKYRTKKLMDICKTETKKDFLNLVKKYY